jgi:hypothetical protein
MSSSLGLRWIVRSLCCCSLSTLGLIAWLVVAGSATAVSAQTAPADAIYAGDTVVMIKDGVELGLRDKPAVTLKIGDKIRVTEVRGVWIGGHATVDGQRYSGWVNRREVRLAGTDPGAVAPIEAPALPDELESLAALSALNVKLDKNDKGHVISADATESEVDDATLKHFQGLHHLATLDLSGRPITDEGFPALAKLSVLQELYLSDTEVGDAAFRHLGELKNLEILTLSNTKVTGSELAELKKLPALRVLNLSGCRVGDDSLKPLSDMPQIEVLVISRTKVTSLGLAHLTPITKLRVLNLIGCEVDDSGLTHLEPLENLRMLYVEETDITEEGSEVLTESRPSLAVFH